MHVTQTTEYTPFPIAGGTCAKKAYLNRLSYVKANLNSLKIIEIIQSVFSNCNKIKLEIRKREIAEKSPNVRKLKTHF